MSRTKKRVATIDCETPPFEFGRAVHGMTNDEKTIFDRPELAPFCWGFYDGETFAYFWDDDPNALAQELIDFLSDEDDLIIYAHNGGRFDFHFLLEYMDEDLLIINGRIAKATLFNGAVELRDSYLILPIALGDYDKDTIDYNLFEPGVRNNHKNEIIRYLRKDCTALYELVNSFYTRFGNNLTLASTAFKELKKTGYEIRHTYDDYDDKMRPFYFGGRVQCFEVGSFEGDFQFVDINSAYPFAMMSRHWHGPGMQQTLRLPDAGHGSWFADIKAKSYGALPYRSDKLYFPSDGEVRSYKASGWEIIQGLKTETLEIVSVDMVYKPVMVSSFESYVTKFYDERRSARETGDFVAELFAKLMLNSAYGKFGQDGRRFEKFCLVERGDWPENDPRWPSDMRWAWYCDTDTGHSVFSRPDPSNRFYNVATAASVTAFARAHLWDAILKSERPLYCDTDSIICERFDGAIGKALGEWSLDAELTEAHIAQRKMYAVKTIGGDYKTASKGVRLDFDTIKAGIKDRSILSYKKDAPCFSLKYGSRYLERKINFEKIDENSLQNPPTEV